MEVHRLWPGECPRRGLGVTERQSRAHILKTTLVFSLLSLLPLERELSRRPLTTLYSGFLSLGARAELPGVAMCVDVRTISEHRRTETG